MSKIVQYEFRYAYVILYQCYLRPKVLLLDDSSVSPGLPITIFLHSADSLIQQSLYAARHELIRPSGNDKLHFIEHKVLYPV